MRKVSLMVLPLLFPLLAMATLGQVSMKLKVIAYDKTHVTVSYNGKSKSFPRSIVPVGKALVAGEETEVHLSGKQFQELAGQ